MQEFTNEFIVEDSFIDELYQNKEFLISDLFKDHINNGQFIIFKSDQDEKKTAVFYASKGNLKLIQNKKLVTNGFSPKDINQTVYLNLLKDNDFLIVCALGPAGTGKTTLALSQALEDLTKQKRNIILTKSTNMVQGKNNNAFGPVPGDVKEKYLPYIDSFQIVLNKIMGEDSRQYVEILIEKEKIKFMPIEFTRGCTFENCTVILDEAQNLTWHELKTLMSRMGENSKLIVCGDPDQIDANLTWQNTGLNILLTSNAFQNSYIAGVIHLTKCYRGAIPELIYQIDKQLTERQK
jgi:PhoH-like ATPase